MLITDIAIRNRTTILVMGLLILVIGTYSYIMLPREAFPDIPIPHILITTVYEGISPEDIESSVTMKLEKEFTGIRGVKQIRSTSAEGLSVIDVEFLPDVKIDVALQRVKDKVDMARGQLPADAKEPVVSEISLAEFPIMYISLSGDLSPVQLKQIADRLEDQIEALPGVLKVEIAGALEREIRLEFDGRRLAAYNLTIQEILGLIPAENVNISSGSLDTEGTRFNLRVPAEFVRPDEAEHLLLAVRDGRPVYLSDVARVVDTFKDRSTYSRLNGSDSITLAVQKRAGANIVDVADRVRYVLEKAREQIGDSARFDITMDMSKDIRTVVAELENNVLAALILVVAILMLFMGWRASSIAAMVIPLSMLISFFILRILGYTLNMIVLFSLVLVLGMLVDNAIVIVENVYRHMQLGYDRVQAAILGTREVAWPVFTSTMTTLAAFIPLMFWPGMIGHVMKYLPVTLSIGLLSSLFVALVFSPTICATWAGGRARPQDHGHWFISNYSRLLTVGLRNPGTTLYVAFALLACMGILYVKFGRGVEFFPTVDPARANIVIQCPQGTNIRQTDQIARHVEGRLSPFMPWIKQVITNVGSVSAGFELTSSAGGPHLATVTLVFYDFEERTRPSAQIIAAVREALADIAGAEIRVQREEAGPPTGAPVTVQIIGEDFAELGRISDQIQQRISLIPNLVNLRSDLEAARPELVFVVDRRRASILGLNTSAVGNFLKMAILGWKVGTYRQFNDEYDITVRLPVDQRRDLETLWALHMPNAAGQPIAVSNLGRLEYRGGFGAINHVNQRRVVTLTADAEGRLGSEVLADVQQQISAMSLPGDCQIEYAGQKEYEDQSKAFLTRAFFVALLLISLILVMQFNSLKVPLIIMVTVVLSSTGALFGLLICRLAFGVVMSGIGLVSLAGVVVNNAIVLLDYTRKLQQQGQDLISATAQAARTRLRPVLLTAATTIIGLVPMATGVSFDFHSLSWTTRSQSSQWWVNMAVVVIFGLGLATVLTLVVVPSLYVLVSRPRQINVDN